MTEFAASDIERCARSLTQNVAFNLRWSLEHPCPDNPGSWYGKGGVSTGGGKFTHIAWLGVSRSAVKAGVAKGNRITPFGRAVRTYVIEHWDELRLRDESDWNRYLASKEKSSG